MQRSGGFRKFSDVLIYVWCGLFFLGSCEPRDKSFAVNVSAKDTLEWPSSFGLGRLATQNEIDSIDFDVRPDGQGLPSGSGSVANGSFIYQEKCARCHGKTGTEGPFNVLVTSEATSSKNEKTVGNYWPYATTLYDYVYRSMPYDRPGSLTEIEVYSITAFLLYKNKIIDSTFSVSSENLATIAMPAKGLFVVDDRRDGPEIR